MVVLCGLEVHTGALIVGLNLCIAPDSVYIMLACLFCLCTVYCSDCL